MDAAVGAPAVRGEAVAPFVPVPNRGMITISIMLANIMQGVDNTILNVALPHVQGSLSASLDQIAWALTSYIVCAAIMMPLTGWLAGRFGIKYIFLVSVIGFTLASALCGAAASLGELVFFRALQGVAGAGLIPLSQATLLQINPPERHGHAMAVFGIGTILGPIMGPALGGWLTDDYSWRWVFYINLPVGVLCTLGILIFIRQTRNVHREPFDFVGFLTLSLGIGALQLMLDRGELKDWFHSSEIWIEATVAGLGFYLFTVHTVTTDERSFLNRDLLKSANFVAGTVLMFCGGLIMTGTLALLPTMLQNLMNYPAMTTGLVCVPRGIGSMVAMFLVAPLINRVDNRLIILFGFLLTAVVDVADEPVFAADGHGAGHHLRAVAGFRPRLHPSAAEHHRVVDPAAPHPDPGDGDPQPDAQPRRQHRHQHSGRNLGPEYPGGSLASGRRPAAGQPARAGALSGGAVQPEHAGRDGGAQRRGDAAGRDGRLYR